MKKSHKGEMHVVFKRGRRIVGTLPIFPQFGVPVMRVGKERTTIQYAEPMPKEYGAAAKILSMFMLVNEAAMRGRTHPECKQCGESFERQEPNEQFCSKDCRRAYDNLPQRLESKRTAKRIAMKKSRKVVREALERGVTFK